MHTAERERSEGKWPGGSAGAPRPIDLRPVAGIEDRPNLLAGRLRPTTRLRSTLKHPERGRKILIPIRICERKTDRDLWPASWGAGQME